MTDPVISVVIPVYNASTTIEACLQALAAQNRLPLEVIVVDNGSSDGTTQQVQSMVEEFPCSLRLLEKRTRGAAAARNHGIRAAAGEWIAFTDSDCVPDPDWLETGEALLAEHGSRIAALAGPAWGTLEGDAAARVLGLSSLSVDMPEQLYDSAGATGTLGFAAANLWVRRKALLDLQGFDESLHIAGEDIDLCARLYAASGRICYSPALRVRHIHSSGTIAMCRKMVQYGCAHATLFARHGTPGIHVDMPVAGQLHLPVPASIWCNLASAEKKTLVLLLVSLWQPWLLVLVPIYLYWIGHGLCRRAAKLDKTCRPAEPFYLGMLLVVKSTAITWGRIRGSHRGVWVC